MILPETFGLKGYARVIWHKRCLDIYDCNRLTFKWPLACTAADSISMSGIPAASHGLSTVVQVIVKNNDQ